MTIVPITQNERDALFACLDGVSHAGLAVSGGADSMALMHVARLWRETAREGATRFTILSVDHGLRDESAREVDWVAEQARRIGFACTTLRWKPGEKHSRVQADARDREIRADGGICPCQRTGGACHCLIIWTIRLKHC